MRKLTLALLAILPLMAQASEEHVYEIFGSWAWVQMKDDFTDEDRSFAMSERGRHSLMVLCQSDGEKLLLNTGSYVARERRYNVDYRVDENQPGHVLATPSTKGDSLFLDTALISELNDGDSVVFRYKNHRGTPKTIRINLAGYSDTTSLLGCL